MKRMNWTKDHVPTTCVLVYLLNLRPVRLSFHACSNYFTLERTKALRSGMAFRAQIRWMDGQEERRAYGPRRSERKRAEADLEIMREASSRHEDLLARRKAVDVAVRRLQQQAEQEVRVAGLARRLSQEQRKQQQPLQAAVRCPRYYRSTLSGLRKAPTAPP